MSGARFAKSLGMSVAVVAAAGGGVYHSHLDVCRRCRERPFDLCPEGGKLLSAAALGTDTRDEAEDT